MKVLIVEDETAAFDNLVSILASIDPMIEIMGNTEGVAQTVRWLKNNPKPDLIFMDIHLSDGSAFAIFSEMEVEVPIIFVNRRLGTSKMNSSIFGEAIWFGGCKGEKGSRRLHRQHLVEVVNPEVFNRVVDSRDNTLVLSSHCGNWELYGGIESYNYTDKPLPFNEQNFCVVYRELSSRAWDEVMRDNRFAPLKDRKHFPGYIETKDLIRYAYSHRDEKKIYNVNTDQRPYFESPANMDVDFFGQQVQTMTGAAALARKLGMSVAYLSMRRERRGHYVMRYEPICEDASKLGVAEIMQQYYRLVEADIRQQPENYLWTHQRFARM